MDLFLEFSLVIGAAVLLAMLARALRQPLIISYIITGVILGPYIFDSLHAEAATDFFAHLGVALLLFIVGLNLSPSAIRDIGKVSLVTGLGQVIFTSAIGFLIARGFGLAPLTAAYIAIAVSFSSTIVILKLLSDRGDVEKLYGRIAIGFLIVQDLIAVGVLMVISSAGADWQRTIGLSLLRGVGLAVAAGVVGYLVLPHLTKRIARSQELLMLFALSWALLLSSLFYIAGFSLEIGALLAGVTLSLSPFRFEINHKMRTLRDFFLVVFFIVLGAQLHLGGVAASWPVILSLSLFVLIGNPLIVMTLMGLLGYSKRNGFFAGLTVAQISEFSLIIIALGVSVGQVSADILSVMTAVALITMAGSSYMIMYADRVYKAIAPALRLFERKRRVDTHRYHAHSAYDIVLLGYETIGHDLVESFRRRKESYLVIDYDPETVVRLAKEGIECRYADVNDHELFEEIDFRKAKMVISTISHVDTNLLLLTRLREISRETIIIVVAHDIDEAMELYNEGATYVVMPHFIGGDHTSLLIEKHQFDVSRFLQEQIKHIEYLERKRGHHRGQR